jgi:acyl carrier protein
VALTDNRHTRLSLPHEAGDALPHTLPVRGETILTALHGGDHQRCFSMTVEEIEKKLIQGIASITGCDLADISPHSPFHELGLDSFGFVETLVFIEETFKLKLISTELTRQDFESINLLAQLIARKQ